MSIDAKIANSFITPIIETIESQVPKSKPCSLGPVRLEPSGKPSQEVSIFSYLKGDLYGKLIISLPINVGLEIAEAVLQDDVDSFDKVAQSVVQEIISFSIGSTLNTLNQLGFKTTLSSPKLVVGKPPSVYFKKYKTAIAIPLNTSIGSLEIILAIMQTQKSTNTS